MEKIIKLDINNKDDLYEKYNNSIINKELLNYLIESTPIFSASDNIVILINNQTEYSLELIKLIKEALMKEYKKSLNRNFRDNVMQFVYLLVGILALFISTFVEIPVLDDIIIIGGWVFICTLLEMEISTDLRGRRRRRIIKKLLNSEFVLK